MGDNTYNDFPVRSRKHFPNAQKSSLSLGFTPEDDKEPAIPGMHHLQRSRVSHDTADMYQDNNFTSTNRRDESGASHFTTSYMAQTQGLTESKRPSGKKVINPPFSSIKGGLGTIICAPGGPRRTQVEPTSLQMGTTKALNHVPGYTGFVSTTPKATITERSLDKAAPLHIQNYKGTVPGYTGKGRMS